jgi:hypothetical protein
MSEHYILDGRNAVKTDLMTWARWFEKGTERHVADETINGHRISTVFLGVDHSFGQGPPLLFETMVFGGSLNQEQDRYTTWEQAEAGHKAMVDRVREAKL